VVGSKNKKSLETTTHTEIPRSSHRTKQKCTRTIFGDICSKENDVGTEGIEEGFGATMRIVEEEVIVNIWDEFDGWLSSWMHTRVCDVC
jgi:hypothetical protein